MASTPTICAVSFSSCFSGRTWHDLTSLHLSIWSRMTSCSSQARVRLQACSRDCVQLWRRKVIRCSLFRSVFQRFPKREGVRKRRRRRANMKLRHKKSMELCTRMSASSWRTTQRFSLPSRWTWEIAIQSRSTRIQHWVSSLPKNRHKYQIRQRCDRNRASWLSESCKNRLKEQDILPTKATCKCLRLSRAKASRRCMRLSYKTLGRRQNSRKRALGTNWSKISRRLSMSKDRKRI